MKKHIFLLAFILLSIICSAAYDFTPLYYKGVNGKEYRLQRWYIAILGLSENIEFVDSRDTDFQWDNGYSVQNMYLYEKEDGKFIYFQRYSCRVLPTAPNTAKYTPQNIWAKVDKEWSTYIDSNGNSHKLYKK